MSAGLSDYYERVQAMHAALSTGREGTIRLYAQILGFAPCPVCDFVKSGCRCGRTLAPGEGPR